MPRKANTNNQAKKVYKKKAPAKKVYRKKTNYRYPGVGRSIGGFAGGAIGNMIAPGVGGAVGNALGQVVGHGAQSLIKNVTGFGDYQVRRNSLLYNQDAVPAFHNDDRCTIITHREFICDIYSSPTLVGGGSTFNLQEFRINPAISGTFPWLSGICSQNYEEWVCQGMLFEFKTTSGNSVSSTNASLGTVIMSTQYNALSASFVNKQQMENYEFSCSTVPSASILHPIECDPSQTQSNGLFFIANPNYSAVNADPRLYDLGRFSIATVGMQAANAVLGELWVTYKICLLKPRLVGINSGLDHWYGTGTLNNAFPLSSLPLLTNTSTSYNTPLDALTSIVGNVVTINPSFIGYLEVTWTVSNQTVPAAAVGGDPTITAAGNCQLMPYFGLGSNNLILPIKAYATTTTRQQLSVYVRCNGSQLISGQGMTLTFGVGNFGGATYTDMDLIICIIDPINVSR